MTCGTSLVSPAAAERDYGVVIDTERRAVDEAATVRLRARTQGGTGRRHDPLRDPGRRVSGYRIGADIGGTFTDIVLLDEDGNVISKKISSSVENYALAIVEGLESVFAGHGVAPGEVAEIMHGTTVASNAILERAGARVGTGHQQGLPRRAGAAQPADAAALRPHLGEAPAAGGALPADGGGRAGERRGRGRASAGPRRREAGGAAVARRRGRGHRDLPRQLVCEPRP